MRRAIAPRKLNPSPFFLQVVPACAPALANASDFGGTIDTLAILAVVVLALFVWITWFLLSPLTTKIENKPVKIFIRVTATLLVVALSVFFLFF